MEPDTIKRLAKAASALMKANDGTKDGFVADQCDIALQAISKAIGAAADVANGAGGDWDSGATSPGRPVPSGSHES
jgi:hypothetical protein